MEAARQSLKLVLPKVQIFQNVLKIKKEMCNYIVFTHYYINWKSLNRPSLKQILM